MGVLSKSFNTYTRHSENLDEMLLPECFTYEKISNVSSVDGDGMLWQ